MDSLNSSAESLESENNFKTYVNLFFKLTMGPSHDILQYRSIILKMVKSSERVSLVENIVLFNVYREKPI